jgi:hypothetical protein
MPGALTPVERYLGYGFGIVLGLLLVAFSKQIGEAFAQVMPSRPS